MGTTLQFSSVHHPQTHGQTDRSLGVGKNKASWSAALPHAKFAYNKSKSRSTDMSLFEVVYGGNPNSPLDLVLLLVTDHFSGDAHDMDEYI